MSGSLAEYLYKKFLLLCLEINLVVSYVVFLVY